MINYDSSANMAIERALPQVAIRGLLVLRRLVGPRDAATSSDLATPVTRTPTDPVLSIEVTLNTGVKRHAGQPVAEVKAQCHVA